MTNITPVVSIIIPCRNEAHFIDRCLESVFAFEPVDGDFEVLVVDGLSNDATREKLAEWKLREPRLHVLDNPARIVPIAMNIGIRAARGQWLVRLDAHSEYPPDYLRLCIETSNYTGAENVGGVFITQPRGNTLQARLVQALTTHRFGVGQSDYRLDAQEGSADTVPYGCYRREVLERIGLFDERLVRNQDYELNRRLLHNGGQIWCNPKIQVFYYNQGTLRGLYRQALFTGQWNPWTWYVAPYAFAPRHAIPGAFVMALLGALLLSLVAPRRGLPLIALILAPYTTLAFFSAWQQARRYGWWMFFVLPFLFFSYHCAYRAGILWGSARLLLRTSPVQRSAFDSQPELAPNGSASRDNPI